MVKYSLNKEYYLENFKEYHEKTFYIDPNTILSPLSKCLAKGSKILDVGCGSGRDLLWFKKRGYHVTGFERSPGLLKLALEYVSGKR